MNKIEILLAVKRHCEKYGAHYEFLGVNNPIKAVLPDAGAQSGEVVNCFIQELLNLYGIYSNSDGRIVTIDWD